MIFVHKLLKYNFQDFDHFLVVLVVMLDQNQPIICRINIDYKPIRKNSHKSNKFAKHGCIKMFLIFIFIAGRTNRGELHVGSWLLWRSRTLAGGVTFFSYNSLSIFSYTSLSTFCLQPGEIVGISITLLLLLLIVMVVVGVLVLKVGAGEDDTKLTIAICIKD